MNSTSPTADDQRLLQRFAENHDEEAFRTLVEKHTGLVYGVAIRRTNNKETAEEITQNVFLILAKKAGSHAGKYSLGAWLHRVTLLESLRITRKAANYKRHLAMFSDNQTSSHNDAQIWQDVRPLIDQLLNRLSSSERNILVQHYIEGRSFPEIAPDIGLSPAATQKRSVRALEKLSRLLTRSGASVSAIALASCLGTELSQAAPADLASKVSTAVLTSSGSITTTSLLTTIIMNKLSFASAFVLAALIPVTLQLTNSEATASHSLTSTEIKSFSPRKTYDASFDIDVFRTALQQLIESDLPNDDLSRRLQRLIFTLNLTEIKEALTILDEFEKSDRLFDLVGATFARWAELDPTSAVADAESRPKNRWGYYPISGAWMTWAFSDWEAARDWHASHHDIFNFWSYLDWQAELDGPLAVARAVELAEIHPKKGDHYIKRALATWARYDPEKAITWMDQQYTNPIERDAIIGNALQNLGEYHPTKALDSLTLIGNPARVREVRYNIYWSWVLHQPKEAANYLEQSHAGESWHPNTLRSAAEGLARNNPTRALEIARSIKEPKRRDGFYCGILCGAQQSDLSLVLEAADAISEEGARTNNSLGRFLEHWAARDYHAASAWVEALPNDKKKKWARHMLPTK